MRELHIVDLLRSLIDANVQFIVFGAVAAGLHGHIRATRDLDILVDSAGENIERVVGWLLGRQAHLTTNPEQPFAIRHARQLHLGENASLLLDLGEVDVVQRLPGLAPWAELSERADVFEIEGMTLRVMDRATLIERKRLRASPQDLVDIAALEALPEE